MVHDCNTDIKVLGWPWRVRGVSQTGTDSSRADLSRQVACRWRPDTMGRDTLEHHEQECALCCGGHVTVGARAPWGSYLILTRAETCIPVYMAWFKVTHVDM